LHWQASQITISFPAVRGGVMWRFGGKRPAEAWEAEIASPIGDIEAADLIRTICRSAADSAERIGGVADAANGKKRDRKRDDYDSARYQAAAKRAMEIAMKMSDELMRDAAVGEIVDLCLKANDIKTATILFRAIQAPSIREIVLSDHPALRQ
jgi:hypothetical protein